MGDQPHSLCRIAVQRQLYEPNYLLLGSIHKVFVRVSLYVKSFELDYLASIGWAQDSFSAGNSLVGNVPDFHLVIVIHCQQEILFGVGLGVPDAGSGRVFFFYLELVGIFEAFVF